MMGTQLFYRQSSFVLSAGGYETFICIALYEVLFMFGDSQPQNSVNNHSKCQQCFQYCTVVKKRTLYSKQCAHILESRSIYIEGIEVSHSMADYYMLT